MPTLKVWDGSAWVEVKGDKGDPGEVTNADLESRVSPIEGDVSAIDTRVTTVETETAEAVAKATRADARVFDAAAFGPTDNANIAASLQAASDAAMAETGGVGGTITLPTGSYRMAAGVDIGSNTLDLNGSTLDFIDTTSATRVRESGIFGGGSVTELPDLSEAPARYGRTLTFATIPDVTAGDLVLIENADASFRLNQGEFAKVLSRLGNDVTLENPTFTAYPATAKVYKVAAAKPAVTNGTVKGKNGVRPIFFEWCERVSLTNLDLSGSPHTQAWISRAYDVLIDNVHAWNTSSGTSGTEYGLAIGNAQRVIVTGVHTDTMRHGITTGGAPGIGDIPCRQVVIADSTVGSHGSVSPSGIGLHDNLEYCLIDNNILPSGINIGGDHLTITRNHIWRGNYLAAIYSGDGLLGWNVAIEDNTFHGEAGYADGQATVTLNAMTRTVRDGTTLRVNRNTFHRGAFQSGSGSSRALAISQINSSMTNLNVEVVGNLFDSIGLSEPVSPPIYNDIYITTNGSPFGRFNRVVITDNQCSKGAINILNSHIHTLIMDRNHVESSAYHGIYVTVPDPPVYANSEWYLRENIVTDAYQYGVYLDARGVRRLTVDDNTFIRSNGIGSAHALNGAGCTIRYATKVLLRRNVLGDDRSTPLQVHPYAVAFVSELIDQDNEQLNNVNPYITSVTTHRYRGEGLGAPSLACADGSTYINRTQGVANAWYVRQNGAWVTK